MRLLKLNLGSADRHIEGYVSVDKEWPMCPKHPGERHVHGSQEFHRADLSQRWPWANDSVESIIAYDIIEHLPDRIFTMNEMWRVLVPGGIADIEVPDASKGCGFHQDPTHISPWCMNSFQYYQNGSFAVQRLADSYGIRARFDVVSLEERRYNDVMEDTWKIKAILRAVK